MTEMLVNNFSDVGHCMIQLEKEDLAPIWDEVNAIRENFDARKKANRRLIGSIKKQYELIECKDHVQRIVCAMAEGYETYKAAGSITGVDGQSMYKPLIDKNLSSRLMLEDLWVNFQEKHEFLPVHVHAGIYSFALWLDVPYTMEEEYALWPDAEKEELAAGQFQFIFPKAFGGMTFHRIPTDKSFNGKIALWPAGVAHQAYPFYSSDGYRIVVAGNLKIGAL